MGVPSARFPVTRHSRAGGNPGSFSVPVGLDTRFREYDGISESNGPLYSGFFHHYPAGIFEGAHEGPEGLGTYYVLI
jgi:hypothetical protein